MELPISRIAQLVGGKVIGDQEVLISGIASLEHAVPGQISFLTDKRYKGFLNETQASALIVGEETHLFKGPQVLVASPALAYARVAALFTAPVPRHPGVSREAVVDGTSTIGKNASVYPMAYVGRDVQLGDDVVLFPGVFVGDRVKIGDRTVIYPNVTILQDCVIGKDVIIHPGTVIGSDGFGFVRDGQVSVKIPQTGIVQIDDDVEIGANNCVDRAAFGKTWIQRGVKTDNLVQVGHNVIIGEDTVVVALAGISGSTRIGRGVIIGGQVGVGDHLEIGDRAILASQAGVAKSVSPGEIVSGTPAISHRLYLRASTLLSRLPQLNERVRNLEKRMEKLGKK